MGWTFKDATHHKANGKVDVKAECDALWNCGHMKVLKSSMVGSTYYAAVEVTGKRDKDGWIEPIPKEEREVFAAVVLTSTRKDDGFDFGYKDMEESMGPYQSDCPISILNLLTPTDREFAINWRKRCRENAEKKKLERKDPNSLNNLPIGSVIECNGKQLIKSAPNFQFKRPFWKVKNEWKYYSLGFIKARGFNVISRAMA